ncbi:restriction endonuclease subunit S [Ligilactobacillus salivarius]|uniref:restriction endonuclease subunit S n=1 Tax=Ligilactobacillus salivarius TaxID=1624 RepID=UPI000C7A872A|nr:restriction endonuclease subunit S [Ligilactobacillus salivarius]PLA94489.1 restriction endonuclease subunit S [Ligilactobacillus salivarius]
MFPTQFTSASFTWERKKLGDVAEKVIQKNNNNVFKNVLTNSAEHGIISQRDFFERNIANKNNISTYYIVQNDDFVYNPRISNSAPYGPINRNKTGYTGIISPLYYVFRVLGINTAFIEWYFKTTCWHKFMYQHGDSGARSDRFSIKDNELKKLPIKLPADDTEQEKIAKTLNSLNNTIQLHENYLQLLYNFRSFLLQKMFSINDTFPNLRFKQFNDKWKYKKLGEVADIVSGGTPDTTKRDYWNGSINWYTPAEVGNKIFVGGSQRKITNIGLENSSAKILPVGTVLFTSRAGIGKTAILKEKGSTNQGFQSIVPKKKSLDSYFIFSMSNILKKYGESHGAGSTFLEISGKELAKARISLPSITEQKNISKVLFKLDTIITLQKQEIDNLKKLKQFLLQNMFI